LFKLICTYYFFGTKICTPGEKKREGKNPKTTRLFNENKWLSDDVRSLLSWQGSCRLFQAERNGSFLLTETSRSRAAGFFV
jgi:hypothetical protein